MEKTVKFNGLSSAASPYDAADGELDTVLNLIPEDGSLKPLYPGGNTRFTVGNSSCSIQFTHVGASYKHYIIYCEKKDDLTTPDGSYYWWDGTSRRKFDLHGFHANSISAVGNVLCFVGDNDIMYAFWDGTTYVVFSRSDLQYAVTIENTGGIDYNATMEIGLEDMDKHFDITKLDFNERFEIKYSETNTSQFDKATGVPKYEGVKTNAVREIFNTLDADANKYIAGESNSYFKYTIFGVAALRLYDGSHINISNVFVLAPSSMPVSVDYNFVPVFFVKTKNTLKATISLHTHSVKIGFSNANLSSLSSIIQGVDIYLTPEQTFINFDAKPKLNKGEEETNTKLVYYGDFAYSYYGNKDIYNQFDSMSFYHSVFISKEEFNTSVPLKPVSETNEHLSLASFYREQLGAKLAYTYNNRLHLGNVNASVPSPLSVYPTYLFQSNPQDVGRVRLFSFLLDNEGYPAGINSYAVFVAHADSAGKSEHYYSGIIPYPLPPVISIPAQASQMDIYLSNSDGYHKKTITLTRSTSFGMSYYINTGIINTGIASGSTQLKFLQYNDIEDGQRVDNGTWSVCSQAEYTEASANVGKSLSPVWQPNVLKVSEAENPFLFPPANTVAVGVGAIMGIVSNTEPITEGQFGDAPLYVFTSEGTWALTLNNTGTYVARQPVSRDVLKSSKSVTPIANAVLFASNRGIMMLAGSRTTCITDAISGIPFVFPDVLDSTNYPFLTAMNVDPDTIRYVDFKSLFLKDVRMIYDYINQRIIVFNPAYRYAYVYSLRSQLWGAMENIYKDAVPSYPESLAIMLDPLIAGKHIAVDINDHDNSPVKYLLCTRPLKLDARDVHKTISQLIVRGMFREGHLGAVIYGSNDLYHWFPVNSSVTHELNNKYGTPYKHFRLACVGNLSYDESISGFDSEVMPRLNNKLR